MSDSIEFVDGLIVKAPREGAPEFIKAALSIKRQELADWLANRPEEWINVDIKEAKSGKWYASVNTFKPKDEPASKPERKAPPSPQPFYDDDLPL